MTNSKALVEVRVPASGEKYDVLIPLDSKIGEITRLISKIITDLSNGKYQAGEDAILCNADNGIIYDVNVEAAEQNIRTGQRLMLI
ncbi:MAG: methyltransferase [Lachnospiraceae bacterium]|nr:methyltransferase [Lachnospiraceae bacterium]